jgi:hypothetical protein
MGLLCFYVGLRRTCRLGPFGMGDQSRRALAYRSSLLSRHGTQGMLTASLTARVCPQAVVRALRYTPSDGLLYVEAAPRAQQPHSAGDFDLGAPSLSRVVPHPAAARPAARRLVHTAARNPAMNSRSQTDDAQHSAAGAARASEPTSASTDGSQAAAGAASSAAAWLQAVRGAGHAATAAAAQRLEGAGASAEQPEAERTASATPAGRPSWRRALQAGNGRWRVSNTSTYPFRAVAYLTYVQPSSGDRFQCSGTFVSPVDVLTAAHCVWDFAANTGFRDWRLWPALPSGSVAVKSAALTAEYVTFYRSEALGRGNKTVPAGSAAPSGGAPFLGLGSARPGGSAAAGGAGQLGGSYAAQRVNVNYYDLALIRVSRPHDSWLGIKYDCGRVGPGGGGGRLRRAGVHGSGMAGLEGGP